MGLRLIDDEIETIGKMMLKLTASYNCHPGAIVCTYSKLIINTSNRIWFVYDMYNWLYDHQNEHPWKVKKQMSEFEFRRRYNLDE